MRNSFGFAGPEPVFEKSEAQVVVAIAGGSVAAGQARFSTWKGRGAGFSDQRIHYMLMMHRKC